MNSKNKIIRLIMVFFFCSQVAIAQEISGTVVDSLGPLPGAHVRIKGTKKFVVTDAEGNYTIKVDSTGQILVFTFVGFYTVEKKVKRKKIINVKLEQDQAVFHCY